MSYLTEVDTDITHNIISVNSDIQLGRPSTISTNPHVGVEGHPGMPVLYRSAFRLHASLVAFLRQGGPFMTNNKKPNNETRR